MFEFFNPRLMYLILLPLCAVLCITGGILLLKVNKENLEKREKLPRAALPGAILGIIDLLWCIPNAMPILPEPLHKYLLPLAILLIILAYCALDHLFSRAIGGFMILTAHFYLKESFASPTILSAVFATLCLIFGTIGIFISGKLSSKIEQAFMNSSKRDSGTRRFRKARHSADGVVLIICRLRQDLK